VRAAIGANRSRLVRLFLTESVVLAAFGAAVGLVVAVVSVKGLLAWTPIQIPRSSAPPSFDPCISQRPTRLCLTSTRPSLHPDRRLWRPLSASFPPFLSTSPPPP